MAICNAGQINGLTEEQIVGEYAIYGHIERVLLIPGKSCSFLSYKLEKSAVEALTKTSGALKIAQDGKPVIISFVESLPEIPDNKIYDELPPGLILLENFVTIEEEENLLLLLKDSDFKSEMKHRLVKHYGYEFRYDTNNIDKDKPLDKKIPIECNFLWDKLSKSDLPYRHFVPDQLTINHYKPGQGIPSHVDTHSAFEDPILSLSLLSPIVMEFKKNNKTICLLLPRRSLLIISGESRYDWTHGIPPKTFDFYKDQSGCVSFQRQLRVSFTFRKILFGKCQCQFKLHCDDNNVANSINIGNNKMAADIEKQHVHQVYEDIASHFSETRHKPWPNVVDFVQGFENGSILVDVGCGNGKYFGANSHIFEVS